MVQQLLARAVSVVSYIALMSMCNVLQLLQATRCHFVQLPVVLLPHCMQCRRGLAIRILYVCPSVRLSHACIVTKRKKDLSRFLHHTKDNLA